MKIISKYRTYFNEQLLPGITMPNFAKKGLVSRNELVSHQSQDRKDHLGKKIYSDYMSFFDETCFFNGFMN
jgi:hypothetical protein